MNKDNRSLIPYEKISNNIGIFYSKKMGIIKKQCKTKSRRTLDSKGELLITLMSSLSQEESRSISLNTAWGKRKSFADGKVSLAYSTFLGYDKGDDGKLKVNKEQAKTIKLIFKLFLEGHSAYHIGQVLTDKKIKSPMGKDKWQTSSVLNILQNEKYKGDAILQKCFTTDFLSKKRKVNEGELPQYYVTDDHEAIIDRGTFDLVQTELVKRRGVQGRTVFSGKIKCAECGCYYGAKVWHSIDKENLSA